MAAMTILFVVNSVFGARKAPGFRPWQLVRFGACQPRVIARGSAVDYAPISFPLPGRSLIPRGLNFLRIKFFPRLPAREIEQELFDFLCERRSRWVKETPRAVHLWDHLPRTAAYWKQRGARVLIDLHMAHPRCYQPLVDAGRIEAAKVGSLEDPAADACIAIADVLVCPSEFVKESLPEDARHKAVVIPFGADPVAELPSRVGHTGPVRVLFAGNINQRKGVPFLLEAWRKLGLPPAEAELVMCGRVFSEAADWVRGAPPGVRFEGFQSDMTAFFASADIFVLPSLMEGSAKAVYEAMAYGLPPIVTPHTGSIVRDGVDGLVVEAADADSLAGALKRLITDVPLRAAIAAAAKDSAKTYSWEAYAHGVAALYRQEPAPAAIVPDIPPAKPDPFEPGSYFQHIWPASMPSKVNVLLNQGQIYLKSVRAKVDTTGNWLRFPFYHHIFADERWGFARHLEAMKNYGEFISLDDAVSLIENKTPLDGRYICLSFDDGFRNCLTNALPMLAERSVPGAFFVVSGLVPDDPAETTPEHLRCFGPRRRPIPFLSWDDCRALLAAGMTIGSHSASHRPFIGLSDAEAFEELRGSKAAIEAALGIRCDHFCCPWGKPERDFKVARETANAKALGYRSFLTTKYGAMSPGDSPYAIRRVGILARFGTYQLQHFLSL